jgi:hypothetical protein
MQGITVAAIGFLGVLIPSLLAVGSAHGRRLHRIMQESEALKALPEELHEERQLIRYLLNCSVWDYAITRRRTLRPFPFLLLGLGGSLLAGLGWQLLMSNSLDNLTRSGDSNYRHVGLGLFLIGAWMYLTALSMQIRAAQKRIRRLSGPPSRTEQLIALEAMRVESASLRSLRIGTPADWTAESGLMSILARRLVLNSKWKGLDEAARTVKHEDSIAATTTQT